MLGNLEEMQKAGKMQLDTAGKSAMVIMQRGQKMSSEAVDQARESMEKFTNYFERIAGVKSLEEAVRINTEFAVANWERFFSGATKMAESYSNLAKEASAPVRDAANATSQAVGRNAERIRATG